MKTLPGPRRCPGVRRYPLRDPIGGRNVRLCDRFRAVCVTDFGRAPTGSLTVPGWCILGAYQLASSNSY